MDYTVLREITRHEQPSDWQVVKGQSGLILRATTNLGECKMSIQNIDKIKLQITGLYGDQTGQTLLFLIPVNRNQRLIREAAYSAKRFLDYAQDVFSGQPIKPLVEIRLILTDGTDVPFATELNVPDRIAQALKIFSSQLAD